jgi:hypothetical protein
MTRVRHAFAADANNLIGHGGCQGNPHCEVIGVTRRWRDTKKKMLDGGI